MALAELGRVRLACCLMLLSTPGFAGVFDEYLAVPFVAADGFDWPRAPVAAAHGRVAAIDGERVELEHVFFENHGKRLVRTAYSPVVEVRVRPGDEVRRGDSLGRTKGKLRFEVLEAGAELAAASFVAGRPMLVVPSAEPQVLLVDSSSHRLRYLEAGKPAIELDVGIGQGGGPKRQRGDLKTPVGMYFVIEKRKGEFPGEYGGFFGGHWIKVNYPNAFDAAGGLAAGRVTAAQATAISEAWRRRAATDQRTALGGGIGLHGWAGAWDGADGGYGLSWGCVVLHNEDIETLFGRVPVGTLVVLL